FFIVFKKKGDIGDTPVNRAMRFSGSSLLEHRSSLSRGDSSHSKLDSSLSRGVSSLSELDSSLSEECLRPCFAKHYNLPPLSFKLGKAKATEDGVTKA
ncbi:hypothetical protein, partial [Bhargavaea cecembensis]|uniref:hypothetical protein n=1 Tax=Bhargavaea cecembensis TaxID=394098 RepID=UPI001F1B5F81